MSNQQHDLLRRHTHTVCGRDRNENSETESDGKTTVRVRRCQIKTFQIYCNIHFAIENNDFAFEYK